MNNKYEIRGEVTAIYLESAKHGNMEAVISTSRFEKVQGLKGKWSVWSSPSSKNYYCQGSHKLPDGTWISVKLHRWITDCPEGMLVDHFNNETMDNTDENLRIVTRAENRQNQKGARIDSKSGYRNISFNTRFNKWRVVLQTGGRGKKIDIGYFSSVDEAVVAEANARAKHYPFSREAAV